MPYLSWLGPLRDALRRTTFDFLGRAFAADEGRRILAESLAGQLAAPAADAIRSPVQLATPYPELGVPPAAARPPAPAPVFITARFRSGSTLLWNIFRQVPGCTAYYEPLNERRWFDAAARGDRVDTTHVGVADYWREYEGLGHLGRFYRERWIDRQLYMSDRTWDPDLKAYIRALIDAAPGQAVLQFNRVDFRLQWLRRQFPEGRIIHLFRHPRDQWCSSLVNPARCGPACSMADFAAHDHFYLLPWARDLRYQFPFLDPDACEHPYDLFYLMWKLSFVFGRRYADASFCYEELVRAPEVEIPRLVAAAGVDVASIAPLKAVIAEPPASAKWPAYAPDEWFKRRESACESLLADFLRPRTASTSLSTA